MEKRIELERRGRDPAKIRELILDDCKSTTITGLSDKWESLENLSLMNVGLTTLKGFPNLTSLKKLELSENRISGGLEALTVLKSLSHLNMTGNKIKDLSSLEPLKKLENLSSLDLLKCEVSQIENYRDKIFALIPTLVFLDGFDKDDNSEDDDEDEEDLDGQDEDDLDLDEEDDLDEEEEDEDEEDVPLDALYKDYNPEGDNDYEAGEEEEEDDDIDEETAKDTGDTANDTEEGGGRGKKRKHEEEQN